MLREIYRMLSGNSGRQLYQRPWQQYYNIQRTHLENFILFQEEEDPSFGRRIREIIGKLSPQSFTRVLLAPEVSFHLSKKTCSKDFLMGVFEVEGIREGQALEVTGNGWSALGDYCLKEKREFLQGPRQQNIIPLDFHGPWISADDRDSIEYNDEERVYLEGEMNEAMKLIQRLSPAIYDFIMMGTWVLQIRKNDARTYTYSTENYTGRVFFVNPMEHYKSTLGLAGGIYHEAIHNYLYITERFQHMIKDKSYREQEIISPWTGNNIQTHSFMHAIFVWYGLWKLYQVTQQDSSLRAESRRLVNEASFGFRKNCEIISSLSEDFLKKVHPNFLNAAKAMQRDVLERENAKWPEIPFHLGNFVHSSLHH